VKIFTARIRVRVEDAEPVVYRSRTRQVVVADRLAEGPRPAVNHQPKLVLFIYLDFDEVIPTAECRELERAFVPADGLKARMAERSAGHVLGLLNECPPVSAARGHCPAKFCQDARRNSWIIQGFGFSVQGHSQHPTSDVASNGLWIDKVRCGDDNSDAYVGREMNVGHHRNLLNIRGAPEALDRLRHFQR
jgi:hypothetical protein